MSLRTAKLPPFFADFSEDPTQMSAGSDCLTELECNGLWHGNRNATDLVGNSNQIPDRKSSWRSRWSLGSTMTQEPRDYSSGVFLVLHIYLE